MSRSLDGVRRSKLSRLATMPIPAISTVAGENRIRSSSGAKKHIGRDSFLKNTIVLKDASLRLWDGVSPIGRPKGLLDASLLDIGKFNTIVFFRKESRPQCFFAPEEERILFSPATVEMAGIGIVANRESFDRLTPSKLRDIIREVADNPCT